MHKTIPIYAEPKLSNTGKMPCPSFSTPATACITGSKLSKVKGSVCHGCYALKGNYRYPNVKAPREHNLALLDNLPVWTMAMIKAIANSKHGGFFRWHDSGDVQSLEHLRAIMVIANALPDILFWLPSKEAGIVKQAANRWAIPSNLIIRISAPMVDQKPTLPESLKGLNNVCTSTVHTDQPFGQECIAYQQGGKCLSCRACWNRDIPNISYPKH